MGYALMKLIHLSAVIVWLGGMAFTLFCLRPAAAGLTPDVRVPFMTRVLGRFFAIVLAVGLLTLATGIGMMLRVSQSNHAIGAAFNMPLEWRVMAALGVVMLLIFGHIRFALYKRLQRASAAGDWPAGGAALGSIRVWVTANLAIGAAIVVFVVMGSVS